jgi:hypothetical protein
MGDGGLQRGRAYGAAKNSEMRALIHLVRDELAALGES